MGKSKQNTSATQSLGTISIKQKKPKILSEEKNLYSQEEIMKEKKSFYESLSKNSDTNLRNINLETLIQGTDISKLDTDTA